MTIMKILLVTLSVVALIVSSGCDSSKSGTQLAESKESLTIAVYPGYYSALIWLAKNRGYFSQHGVDVQLRKEESGIACLNKLLSGKADLATLADFALVTHLTQHPDLRILTVLADVDDVKLVAKRDRGISQISDLKNKRIGLVRNSSAEYYLNLLLMFHRISSQDVESVSLSPSEQEDALAKGTIDAAVLWWPVAEQIEGKLGINAISWSAQKGQVYYWLLVGRDDTLKRRSADMRGVLTALTSAEEFMKGNPDEARRIVVAETGSEVKPGLWESVKCELSLSRPCLLAMEAQLKWLKARQGSQKDKMPNLLEYMHFDALNSVRPEAVQMPH
jgi:NitT/TauT family transport system substrate-binding protein